VADKSKENKADEAAVPEPKEVYEYKFEFDVSL
jgi:hypothetical protein